MSAPPGIRSERDVIPLLSPEEGYARWAPFYDDTPNPVLALEERQVVPLLPELRGKHVLDLCCGTGRWLRILQAYRPASLVGVDSSPAMLDRARQSFPQLVRASCLTLPFPKASFDFVICSFAIGHLAEVAVFARECARVLRPKGRLYVSDLHPKAYAMGWRTRFRDGQVAAEIQTVSHNWRRAVQLFSSAGLASTAIDGFRFGQPEQGIFVDAGKNALFCEATRVPAVLLGRFYRRD